MYRLDQGAVTIEKYRWFQVGLPIRLGVSRVHLNLKTVLLHRFDPGCLPGLALHLELSFFGCTGCASVYLKTGLT